jgi:streptogramin lyase
LKQLADYGEFHDDEQGYVDVADVFAAKERGHPVVEGPGPQMPSVLSSGIWVAVAVAAAVLVLVGGATLVLRPNAESPSDQPASTTVSPTPTFQTDATIVDRDLPVAETTVPAEAAIGLGGVVIFDVASGERFGRLTVQTENAVWVGDAESNSITRIDPATGKITDRVAIAVPNGGYLRDMVVGEDAIWTVSSVWRDFSTPNSAPAVINRVDLATRSITHSYETSTPSTGGDLYLASDALWVSHEFGVDRVELVTTQIETFTYPRPIQDFRWGRHWMGEADGALWLLDDRAVPGLIRVDLATRQMDHHSLGIDPNPEMGWVLTEHGIWFATFGPGTVARFDYDSRETTHLQSIGGRFGWGLYTDGAVWLPMASGTILRLDPESGEITGDIDAGSRAYVIAVADDGALWTLHEGSSVARFDLQTMQETHRFELPHDEGYFSLVFVDQGVWAIGEHMITEIEFG